MKQLNFSNNIPSGGSAFTLIDHFLVESLEDVHREICCTISPVVRENEPPYYETIIDINLSDFFRSTWV